jgi:hypothetical protein
LPWQHEVGGLGEGLEAGELDGMEAHGNQAGENPGLSRKGCGGAAEPAPCPGPW